MAGPEDHLSASSSSTEERLVSCCLLVPRFLAHGSGLKVVGNIRQLGSWRASEAVQMTPSDQDENMYSVNVQLPLGEKIEAKVSSLR